VRLPSATLSCCGSSRGVDYAFTSAADSRERGQINRRVTGRLGESLGGILIFKSYTGENARSCHIARGAHRLFRNVARPSPAYRQFRRFSSGVIGAIAVVMIVIVGNAVQETR